MRPEIARQILAIAASAYSMPPQRTQEETDRLLLRAAERVISQSYAEERAASAFVDLGGES